MKLQDRKDYFTVMVIALVVSIGFNIMQWNTVQELRSVVTTACDQGLIPDRSCELVK